MTAVTGKENFHSKIGNDLMVNGFGVVVLNRARNVMDVNNLFLGSVENKMKLIGFLIMIIGITFGLGMLYLGIRVMFIGGIIDIINQVKAVTTDAVVVAFAIAKILFAGIINMIGIWGGILITGVGIKGIVKC